MNKRNYLRGLISGILAPIFGMISWFVLYFERKGMSWDQYTGAFEVSSMLRTRIMALGLIFIIPVFMYFYNRNNMDSMRGIITALFLYALTMVILMVT